jgi:hypothetical protein
VSAAYDDLLVFCDYMLESFSYGIGVKPNSGEHEYGSIYRMGMTNARTEKWSPKKVANSFEIFLDLAMQDSNDLFL